MQPDPLTQQVEEFHQRLEQTAYFQRQFLSVVVTDRLMRDLQLLHQPPLLRRHLLRRAGEWAVRKLQARRHRGSPASHSVPTIIDSTCIDITDTPNPNA